MNYTLLKKITAIVLSSFISVLSLVLLILSFSKYDDGFGTSISMEMDYVVLLICGMIALIYNITNLNKNTLNVGYNITAISISLIAGFYPLGVFFKALNKALSKKTTFEFVSYQFYLFIGIASLILSIYFIFKYLENKKANN